MIFIIRTQGDIPDGPQIRLTRKTPALAQGGTHDFFCTGQPGKARGMGFNVVELHDGWYADDTGGGVAIWGQGHHWEIRDTPFSIKETSSQTSPENPPTPSDQDMVDVRKSIFGV